MSLEGAHFAVGIAHEAVIHVARVNVESGARPKIGEAREELGEGALAGAYARARSVKRGESAVGIEQEALGHIACVNVVSGDHAEVVDVPGYRALVGACSRKRSVERRDGSVGNAQETVNHVVHIVVPSYDRPLLVDGDNKGTCGPRWIKLSKVAVGFAHEAMRHVVRVNVESRYRA